MLRTAFKLQKTDEPKSEDAPDNLFGPLEGHNTSEDGFGGQALSSSLYNWFETHPAAKRVIMAGAALGTTTLLVPVFRNGR